MGVGSRMEELRERPIILAATRRAARPIPASAIKTSQVVPAVRDLGEVVQPEALGLLRRSSSPAEGTVEHARAIGLQHPEVEAETAVAHEMPRAGAHQLAPDAAALLGLQHVERVDLRVEALAVRGAPRRTKRSPRARRARAATQVAARGAGAAMAPFPGDRSLVPAWLAISVERQDSRVVVRQLSRCTCATASASGGARGAHRRGPRRHQTTRRTAATRCAASMPRNL